MTKLACIVGAAFVTTQHLTTVAGQINCCLWDKVQSVRDIHPTTDHSVSPRHANCACATVRKQENESSFFFFMHIVRRRYEGHENENQCWVTLSHSKKIKDLSLRKTLMCMQAPPTTRVCEWGRVYWKQLSDLFAHSAASSRREKGLQGGDEFKQEIWAFPTGPIQTLAW